MRGCVVAAGSMAWPTKDAGLARFLKDCDVAELRVASREWREAIDATLTRLRPLYVPCPLWSSRLLPGLKSLLLDHGKLTIVQPQQLQECSRLTQLTQLHLGGPACFHTRTHHLSWINSLTRLQDLRVRGCTKVRLSVVSCWHTLQQLQSLALIGLAFTAADAPALAAFLAAGSAATLTSLILGDQQGLSFLSDEALQGLGELMMRSSSSGSSSSRLQHLDLSGCIELTDAGVQQLQSVGPSLRTLTLHNCMKVGPGTAALIGSSFSRLTSLNLRGCCQLTDDSLGAVLRGPVCLRLRQLNLQSCGISGSCFPAAASKLAALTLLNLAYCSGLQPLHLTALKQVPGLEELSLAGCAAVSVPGVLQSVLGPLTRLRHLDGSGWTVRGEYEVAQQPSPAAAAAVTEMGSSGNDSATEWAAASNTSTSSRSTSCSRTDEAEPSETSQGGVSESTSSSSSSSSERSLPLPPPPLLPPQLQSLKLAELNCSASLFKGIVSALPKTLTSLDLSNVRVAGVGVSGPSLAPLQDLVRMEELNLSGAMGGLLAADLSFMAGLTALSRFQVEHMHGEAAASVPPVAQATATTTLAANAARTTVAMPAGCSLSTTTSSSSTPAAAPLCPDIASQCTMSQALNALAASSRSTSSSSMSCDTLLLDSPAVPTPAVPRQHNQQRQQQQQRQSAGVAALLLGVAGLASQTSEASSSTEGADPAQADTRLAGATADVAQLQIRSRPSSASSSGSSSSSSGRTAVRRNLFQAAAAANQQQGVSRLQSLTHASAAEAAACAHHQQQQQHHHHNLQQQPQQPGEEGDQGAAGREEEAAVWLHMSPSVQHLAVSFSPALGDAELASLGGLTALRSLDLLACHSFTGSSFSSWACASSSLTSLTLTGCSKLTDEGLAALAAALGPQLQELGLPGCRGVTDAGVGALQVATNLRTLNLASNRGLTGRSLQQLFPALSRLRSLSLALCGGLEDEGLAACAAAPRLSNLDLHCCWRLTDTGMLRLLDSSRSLLQVNIDGCPRLSLAACPPHFTAVDELGGGAQPKDSSSTHKRPGLLVRVPS